MSMALIKQRAQRLAGPDVPMADALDMMYRELLKDVLIAREKDEDTTELYEDLMAVQNERLRVIREDVEGELMREGFRRKDL